MSVVSPELDVRPLPHLAPIPHRTGILRRVFSLDHKVIGIQYYFTAMAMALLGGLMAMMIRLQLAYPERQWRWMERLFPDGAEAGIMKPEFYNMLVTIHGTIMVFFFLTIILTGGFGNFLIPLQIGARDMAFPFLNAVSYWLIPPAILILLGSLLVEGGAAGAGWTAYPPLSAMPQAGPGSGLGMTLWLLSLAVLIVSLLMGGLNYITTVINLRAPGMGFMRLPVTTWSLFLAAIIGLLTFPVLTAAAIMLLSDRTLGTCFFLPAEMVFTGERVARGTGGQPLLWQHLFWFLGHPEVYILLLPALGMVGDILATNARKPLFGYRLVVGCLIAISGLSGVVWAHHMFTSGLNPFAAKIFSITTLLISVPASIVVLCYIATLWRARIRFNTPMLFVIGFLSLFVTGGLGGLFLGASAMDVYFHDTYFVVGHFHLVMASAVMFGAFAGTYFWFPKMFGKMMSERLGAVHFWLTLIPVYLVFLPMHFLGAKGMMRRIYAATEYDFLSGVLPMNRFITHAAFLLGCAQLLFLINFLWSLWRGKKANDNPWESNSLEWSAPSPPPHGNWNGSVPVVERWPYDYSVPGAQADYLPQASGGTPTMRAERRVGQPTKTTV